MEQSISIDNGYWDIKDLSQYLKVKIKTLYAMVPDIPHYRIGKLIRFRKQEIDSWMEKNRSMFSGHDDNSLNFKGNLSGMGNADIDRLIRKAIDQSKQETYNPDHGKSDRIEGPMKEIKNGSV
jgi:excisionase family DNA binding protein